MGQPVVHFEIVGKDGAMLRDFYGQLFDWSFDTTAPMDYGTVDRESNLSSEGIGIGGGVGTGPDDYPGHVTFYVAVDDVEAALARAENLGGTRVLGPEKIMDTIELGLINDPEGHLVGVVKTM